MKWLAGVLMLVAVAAAVAGATLAVNSEGGWVDVGRALMTLGVSSFIGGVVASLLKVIERDRQRREIWGQLLRDVVEVDQTLAIARQLIKAHKTARTYGEQHGKIVDARLVLRRVWIDPLVADDRLRRGERIDLRSCLDQMKDFVDQLGKEYEDDYLPVARQQLIDEEYLKGRRAEAVRVYPRSAWPEDPMFQPTRAWALLAEKGNKFPVLRQLISEEYQKSCFVLAFLQIKPMLERRAGIRRRSGALESTVP